MDAIYADAERRFRELEEETKKLSTESKRYFQAVNGMLDHQIGFSKAIAEIYKPISGKVSDPDSIIPEGNPEGIEASEQYCAVVADLQSTLKPDLELIETRIIGPAQELLEVIQSIRKMATKRNHKQLDLDRRQHSVKKYEEKKEKNPKDEERLYKAQADFEIAQQEYDYYNEMLKTELPILFQLEADFIRPLFVSFYYMQLNIFYTLFNRTEELKIPYFDLNTDIVEAFNAKRGDIEDQADAIGITHFKVGHARAKLELTKKRYAAAGANRTPTTASSTISAPPAYSPPPSAVPAAGNPPYSPTGYPKEKATYAAAAPYSPVSPVPVAQTPLAQPPLMQAPATQTCTALYDFTAQAEGDLSFTAGTVIQVVQGGDPNGWWTGTANGATGTFPGNYVQMN